MKKQLPLLEHAPWSPSKADLAGKCPLAFKYRYVDKIKPEEKNTYAKVGTVVHRAQELVLLGTHVDESFATAIKEEPSLTTTEIETVKTFIEPVINFKKRIDSFAQKHPIKEMLTEQQWSITPTFDGCEFFNDAGMMRGIIDLAMRLENDHLIILDHKTARLNRSLPLLHN
jgi:ATP-dependent exoDNAse (exonuclease V) beta subunit